MNTKTISAYNLARGTLLNSKLTLADSGNQPLKLLDIVVSGMGMDPTAGLWLSPLHAIPAVPRVFPFDLLYLDKEYRVLHTAEMGPGIEFPPFHPEVSSALVLPSDTLHRSHTVPGDRLIVCASNDLETILAASSLPAPDSAEPDNQLAVSTSAPVLKPVKSGTIQLTPERASSPTVPPTAFDQSVLTAVAKVAETRQTEPKPVTESRDLPGPGPSMDVADAVLDSFRQLQPTVVEHRIDPEDLFSNWVASAPRTSPPPRSAPPEPPETAKPAASSQPPATEPRKQNGRKSKSQADARAASADTRSKMESAPGSPEAVGTESKTAPSRSTNDQAPARSPASHSPASTFTASSYGMWQVSMPTALAPMAGATSPQSPVKAPAVPVQPSDPTSTKASGATGVRAPQNPPPPPPPAPQPNIDSVAATKHTEDPPKPALRDSSEPETHRPGDFVASLQEKLLRVQQSKSAAPAKKDPEPSALQPTSSAPASLSSVPEVAPPVVKSNSAAQSPVPAKSKPGVAPGGLRSKFRQWLHPTSSPSDRRRANRRYVPGMVAHYFTGGAPKPKNVADISMSGMYLLTDDRWMPGTMIQMTLQKPCASGEKKQSINVLSRIVRRGSDGVAAEFIMPEALPHISHDIQPSQATDKFALARFL